VYAIIQDGGHQFRVEPGDTILIERTGLEPGAALTFSEVLFVDGKVGQPTVSGAHVEAVVEKAVRGPKIEIVKYKRRKNYRRHTGHRQDLTRVVIKSIHA
jgi:large subunit ribosomal protein L21